MAKQNPKTVFACRVDAAVARIGDGTRRTGGVEFGVEPLYLSRLTPQIEADDCRKNDEGHLVIQGINRADLRKGTPVIDPPAPESESPAAKSETAESETTEPTA